MSAATSGEPSWPIPDFAEPVIGPATSGRTRWLHPGYLLNQTNLLLTTPNATGIIYEVENN
jgi:hypothetical protein